MLAFLIPIPVLLAQSVPPGTDGGQVSDQSLAPRFNLVSPSPEVAALMRYGSTPVDLHKGLAKITVPIYTIRLRDLEIPITLSYHAGGIRVDELASSVGLGWTLNCGGVMGTTVHGIPDGDAQGWQLQPSEYQLPQTGDLRTSWSAFENYEQDPGYDFMKKTSEEEIDTQPDIRYINVLGQSIRYFEGQHTPGGLMPQGRYRITGNVLRDGRDVTYTFGETETTVTSYGYLGYEQIGVGMPTSRHLSSYFLSGISTPSGETVSYGYREQLYSFANQYSGTRYHKPVWGCPEMEPPLDKRTTSTTSVSGKLVESIVASTGVRVSFTYGHVREDIAGGNARALTGIEVRNQVTGQVLRTVSLGYGYYRSCGSGSTDPDCSRLKLLSVTVSGEGSYSFAYQGTALPKRLSYSQDHWGFYNGATNQTLFPADAANGFPVGADRSASATHVLAGILTGITYPTGGSTSFSYEKNPQSSGLRIKSTTDIPVSGAPVSRHYEYGQEQAYYTPSYVYPYYRDSFTPGTSIITECAFTAQSVSSLAPLGMGDGGGGAYSRVTEYVTDKDGHGYTVHEFSGSGGYSGSWSYPFFGPLIRRDWAEGLPLGRKSYRRDAASGKWFPVYEERTEYRTGYTPAGPHDVVLRGAKVVLHKAPLQIDRTSSDGMPLPPLLVRGPEYLVQYYELHSAWVYPTSRREVSYDPSDSSRKVAMDHRYHYDNHDHLQQTRHVVEDSRGDSVEVRTRYVQDIYPHWAHVSTPVSERRTLRRRGGSWQLESAEVIRYQDWPGSYPLQYGRLEQLSPVAPSSVAAYTGADIPSGYALRSSYQYGPDRRLRERVDDGMATTYLWGYGGQYPVAEIRNATHAEVLSALGVNSGTVISQLNATNVTEDFVRSTINTIRNHATMRKAQVSTYTYDPLIGMTGMTDASGRTTYYEYDGLGRLRAVRDPQGNLTGEYQYHYRNQ